MKQNRQFYVGLDASMDRCRFIRSWRAILGVSSRLDLEDSSVQNIKESSNGASHRISTERYLVLLALTDG
jgi:hypothetical protein